jgi:hypothetical protein
MVARGGRGGSGDPEPACGVIRSASRLAGRAALAIGAGALIAFMDLAGTAARPGSASSSDRPPKILTATATYHENTGTVAFSVEVQRHPQKVVVSHGGRHLPATPVRHLQYWWQTRSVQGTKRNCYRIRVKARNRHGLSSRRMRAGRVGSKGCS